MVSERKHAFWLRLTHRVLILVLVEDGLGDVDLLNYLTYVWS